MTRAYGGRLLLAAAIVTVGAAILTGLKFIGSPATLRQQRLDALRVDDLATIERLITDFAGVHKVLPRDLASLAGEPGYSVSIVDPESSMPYEYEVLDVDTYRVCATFTTSSNAAPVNNLFGYTPTPARSHGAGRQCFSRRVDLEQHREKLH